MERVGDRHLHAVHEDWNGVAAALNVRMSIRRATQREVALAAGVSVATLRVLQRGNGRRRVQNGTLAAVARALGWPDDHLIRILLGEQCPQDLDLSAAAPPTPPNAPAPLGDFSVEILDVLRRIERSVDDIAGRLTRA
jgi:hypothetical protein